MTLTAFVGWLVVFVALGGILRYACAIGLELLEMFDTWRAR